MLQSLERKVALLEQSLEEKEATLADVSEIIYEIYCF